MDELFTPLVPPVPQRLCPDCKVELERTLSRFTVSENPNGLFSDGFQVDFYTCPSCGLVRVYSSAQRDAQERAIKEAAQPPQPPVATEKKDIPRRPTGPADPWEKKKGGLFGLFGDGD